MTKYSAIAPGGWGAGVPRWLAGLGFAATLYGLAWCVLQLLIWPGVSQFGDGNARTRFGDPGWRHSLFMVIWT